MISTHHVSKLRNTAIRSQLLKLLEQVRTPISVADILTQISANKTTIYRELEVLINNQLVQQVSCQDSINRYESKGLDHHHHIYCIKCKSVFDLPMTDTLSAQQKKLEKRYGVRILDHSLEFTGYCSQCLS